MGKWNSSARTLISTTLLACSSTLFAEQQSAVFELKPSRCVALHQGQVCYQHVVFSWQGLSADLNYCIVANDIALHCWLGSGVGRFTYDFGSDKNQVFQLRREDGRVVQERELMVAWVYKSRIRRSTNWKLF